jgi:hypothetical protein
MGKIKFLGVILLVSSWMSNLSADYWCRCNETHKNEHYYRDQFRKGWKAPRGLCVVEVGGSGIVHYGWYQVRRNAIKNFLTKFCDPLNLRIEEETDSNGLRRSKIYIHWQCNRCSRAFVKNKKEYPDSFVEVEIGQDIR